MKPPFPRLIRELTEPRINRAPSPILLTITPWLVVLGGSLVPFLPLIASAPVMPPLGFLLLVAWMQHRPGVFPPWAGFPLGLFDDLLSGQPFGSAALLWSLTVLGLDFLETRLPYRVFTMNWLIASGLAVAYLIACAVFAGTRIGPDLPALLGPQLILSILLYPLLGRLVALLDRFRLLPIRVIG